ncbi:sensor histidine kinase [Paenisporosarcina antarctica]|uniref:Sensor histidine kinase n=1 Tax=Paenisporosarcina antarctica TaxID=417367 RepID=A0A4P6ZXA9_9BACL|nr:sensor histidine kinase [Paenisporosarcina antarctica]QBP41081.1 sensor histidine kinase [Paenisporosarcina antarctica]
MMKLFENSTEAIFFFDPKGTAIAINPAAEKIVDPEVLTQLLQGAKRALCQSCRGYTSDTNLHTCINCYLSSSQPDDFSSFQVYLETRDAGVIPYTATFHTIDAENDVRVFMLRNMTKQFKTQERLSQNTMMKHVIEAQENERKRISRELHDGVAQELLSALVDIRVTKYMSSKEEILNKIKQTEATMTRLLDDIRNLSVELRPAALDDLGLEAAFRSHFKRIQQSYGLLVDFKSDISKKRYGSEIETVIYRVCQEAMLNAIKYAQVEVVKVFLFEKGNTLHLIVQDEGIGFNLLDKPIGTGLGLFGMSERSEIMNGDFEVSSGIGKGTTVRLNVPVGDLRKEG